MARCAGRKAAKVEDILGHERGEIKRRVKVKLASGNCMAKFKDKERDGEVLWLVVVVLRSDGKGIL